MPENTDRDVLGPVERLRAPVPFDTYPALTTGLMSELHRLRAAEAELTVVRVADTESQAFKPDDVRHKIILRLRGGNRPPTVFKIDKPDEPGELWPRPVFESWFARTFTNPHIAFDLAAYRLTAVRRLTSSPRQEDQEVVSPVSSVQPHIDDLKSAQDFGLRDGEGFDSFEEMRMHVLRFFDGLQESPAGQPQRVDLYIFIQGVQDPVVVTLERPTSRARRVTFQHNDVSHSLFGPLGQKDLYFRAGIRRGDLVQRFVLRAQ